MNLYVSIYDSLGCSRESELLLLNAFVQTPQNPIVGFVRATLLLSTSNEQDTDLNQYPISQFPQFLSTGIVNNFILGRGISNCLETEINIVSVRASFLVQTLNGFTILGQCICSILRFTAQQFSFGLFAILLPHLLCFQVARQIEGDTLSFHT